jgi:hypothetical protein
MAAAYRASILKPQSFQCRAAGDAGDNFLANSQEKK